MVPWSARVLLFQPPFVLSSTLSPLSAHSPRVHTLTCYTHARPRAHRHTDTRHDDVTRAIGRAAKRARANDRSPYLSRSNPPSAIVFLPFRAPVSSFATSPTYADRPFSLFSPSIFLRHPLSLSLSSTSSHSSPRSPSYHCHWRCIRTFWRLATSRPRSNAAGTKTRSPIMSGRGLRSLARGFLSALSKSPPLFESRASYS